MKYEIKNTFLIQSKQKMHGQNGMARNGSNLSGQLSIAQAQDVTVEIPQVFRT